MSVRAACGGAQLVEVGLRRPIYAEESVDRLVGVAELGQAVRRDAIEVGGLAVGASPGEEPINGVRFSAVVRRDRAGPVERVGDVAQRREQGALIRVSGAVSVDGFIDCVRPWRAM